MPVDALSQDWQGRLMYKYMFPPPFPLLSRLVQKLRTIQEGEMILIGPLWPSQPWFPHLLRLCVEPPTLLSIPPRPAVTTLIYLEWQVVLSARMEALMQHYHAAEFSKEVSKLAAAPRRPLTNRMYDDRWLRFANWATGKGFDPLGPTAAQIVAFLFELFDTRRLRLSKDTGPV